MHHGGHGRHLGSSLSRRPGAAGLSALPSGSCPGFLSSIERPMARKKLYLVDGSTLIFRAFFAIRHLSNSKGLPTNAVYGFTSMLRKLIRDEQPDYLAVVFDRSEPTFRKKLYPAYKAQRPPAPEDLVPQFSIIREVTRAFNIVALELAGYEADDIIGTLAERFGRDCDTVVVSSDKDLMQLITPTVSMLDTMKNVRYGPDEVHQKMGVHPGNIIDYLALMGDKVDNIPGVPGIGKKSAAKLLNQHGSLVGVYEAIASGDPGIKGKQLQNLRENEDSALLSQELATVCLSVPIDVSLDSLAVASPDREKLATLFKDLEFKTWHREFNATEGGSDELPAAETTNAPPLERGAYALVRTEAALKQAVDTIRRAGRGAFELLRNSSHPMDSDVIGIALATEQGQAWYVPVGHTTLDAVDQLGFPKASEGLKALWDDAQCALVASHSASQYGLLRALGLTHVGIDFDPTLASYLLNADKYSHTVENIALDLLNWSLLPTQDLCGSGKSRRHLSDADLSRTMTWACDRVVAALALRPVLMDALATQGLMKLFVDVELPLARVLGDMEQEGVAVASDQLLRLSTDFGARAKVTEKACHELAGSNFSVGSPKQLSEVLFSTLALPAKKRTKTGFSTDSSVLEELRALHPLPQLVLDWRSLTKLKSTYTDQLPKLVSAKSGRIHTTYGQTVAATGRLSSLDPNLQNIPIRTADGRQIRSAFIPREGHLLVSADYSQIELRILAHLVQSEPMKQAFLDGADIHRRTASEVFGVPEEAITREERSLAKTINFGILYGMSAWRLAREQGISRPEAKAIIERYFARYPSIETWKEATVAKARETSEVRTLMGRLRRVPNIHAPNHQVRSFAERAAINTPIQGTAADIIKAAMVSIQARLLREAPEAKMILQVHDELLFDVPQAMVNDVTALVVMEMENIVTLDVPLKVNASSGLNWLEAH